MFPADNPWNTDVSAFPLHPNSANDVDTVLGIANTNLHPDFGGSGEYGIPYITVPATQPMVPVNFTDDGDESDPGPYPIPLDAPIEGGGDRHVLAIDRDRCKLTGAMDPRWNDTDLRQLKSVPGAAFEVVDTGPVRR